MSLVNQTPDISGERQSGQDVRTQNVVACQAVANIVKTSLGPVGLDKMLVDDIGDVTITNDGATILKMLEVEHPAAKVLVELAELQDREVGDGTTSVVIVAAELLKRANDLVRNKIHPTSIISGYRLAMREACKYVDEKLAIKVEKLGKDSLINCAKTSMSSKLIAGDSDFFANLVVEAVQAVKMTNARGEVRYPIKGINILKAHGKSARDSFLMNGYALNTGRAAQGMPLRVSPAKIACLDFNLQKTKMQLGVQVLVSDPRELEKIRQREADMTKERIEKLLKAGANVVLTTKGIDDMALKYFVEAGAIAVRRVRKEDMRHVAKATGATLVSTFADMEGEETFEPSFLGTADEVVEERIADDAVIMIKGTKTSSAVSLILRGANDYMLDEMDRALHDALSIVKRTLESNTVVAGGGAVEAALSVYLEYLATTLGSREQLAIAEFAESLLIIPKVLAVNAAKDATDLVANLGVTMNSFRVIVTALCCVVVVFGGLPFSSNAQLDPYFYGKTCPQLHFIAFKVLRKVAKTDPRMPASIIRLHFHDCFVQGCDASVLLNNTATIVSEQDAFPNINSLRGLDVINQIKTKVEKACPNRVSCADILTLAAGISSILTGGPGWEVPLGRRDSLTANQSLANQNLPGPNFSLDRLKSAFADQGLNTVDLVALSGAHTFGRARCLFILDRLYNFNNTGKPDPTLDKTYLQQLRNQCPQNGTGNNRVNFDPTTPDTLDKNFYNNLQGKKGLLQSDQELFSTPGADTISIVNSFANSQNVFFQNFINSMIKMGNIDVLTGKKGEIRKQCNFINKKSSELDLGIVASTESMEGDMVSSI